ncbi:MAG: AAA domain-containing protein [Rhodothermaceae bacterium]|nr:AAA domain-containing protein [Rhodothermaceae bacterium]
MTHWIWSVRPEHFPAFVRTGTLAVRRHGRKALAQIQPGDRIYVYLPGSRVLAGAFEATSTAFEDSTALVPGGHYPHRVRVRPVAVLSEEAWIPYEAFATKLTVLDEYGEKATPDLRFRAMMQRVIHRLPTVDGAMLDFLVRTRSETDPERLIEAAERYKQVREGDVPGPVTMISEAEASYAQVPADFDRATALERLIAAIAARRFVYEPWEIAAFVTALRTKPFVLLAGVTGVGKSKLPQLVAEATGSASTLIPVRPDWTDPAEVLGYTDLAGTFRPGALLRTAHAAMEAPEQMHLAVLDEMNLGRPEHYLAEVLSRIEARVPAPFGGWASPPLLTQGLDAADARWNAVRLAPNLALVGTVNVDESAHPFSRKVLDRAFTLELQATDLANWAPIDSAAMATAEPWPASVWWPRAIRLGELTHLSTAEQQVVNTAVEAIAEANALLAPAGLGIGYRARDEAALFALHAGATPDAFRTRDGQAVGPLDLALHMKMLPRLEGSRPAVRAAVLGLFGWAFDATPRRDETDLLPLLDAWESDRRPDRLDTARFPYTAARLARMTDALLTDGYVSFWG